MNFAIGMLASLHFDPGHPIQRHLPKKRLGLPRGIFDNMLYEIPHEYKAKYNLQSTSLSAPPAAENLALNLPPICIEHTRCAHLAAEAKSESAG